jgi:hypothetical protein
MVPNHILNDLRPGECVAILARSQELHFVVHRDSDDPATVRANAAIEGYEVLATHLSNGEEITAFVQGREREVGGEG